MPWFVFLYFGSKYVLLGGDVEYVPTRFAYTRIDLSYKEVYSETDYYYAAIQGNWNENGNSLFGQISDNPNLSLYLWVGRAPVHNSTEVDNFVNKIINY